MFTNRSTLLMSFGITAVVCSFSEYLKSRWIGIVFSLIAIVLIAVLSVSTIPEDVSCLSKVTLSYSRVDEVLRSCCVLSVSSESDIAQGIIISRPIGSSNRVDFVTARHVATYKNVSNTRLALKGYSGWQCEINTASNRWLTCDDELDLAWFELSSSEIEQIDKQGVVPLPLARVLDLDELGRTGSLKGVDANLRRRGDMHNGSFVQSASIRVPMDFGHNKINKNPMIEGFPFESDVTSEHGDSGGVIVVSFGKNDGFYVGGLIVGGNRNGTSSLISSMSAYLNYHNVRRLVHCRHLW